MVIIIIIIIKAIITIIIFINMIIIIVIIVVIIIIIITIIIIINKTIIIKHEGKRNNNVSIQHINLYKLSEAIINYTLKLILNCLQKLINSDYPWCSETLTFKCQKVLPMYEASQLLHVKLLI